MSFSLFSSAAVASCWPHIPSIPQMTVTQGPCSGTMFALNGENQSTTEHQFFEV